MADRNNRRSTPSAVLQIKDLHVYYGQSHALQGVNLTLDHGVHAVVGRNGMGKTTLCNAIMGLLPIRRGSIRYQGDEITGLPPYKIASSGIGYTPQGRRLWTSLTVHEHLKLCEGTGAWTIDRIYDTFPRLFERRRNGAGQLSGGEQQMLAISRALLQDPQLLILDEPTEGLAPVIVDQVEKLLAELAADADVSILLIEQNISVATSISEDVAIMANGRISRVMPAGELAADRALQERLLGVGRHSHDEIEIPQLPETSAVGEPPKEEPRVSDEKDTPVPEEKEPIRKTVVYKSPTRWSRTAWEERVSKPDNSPQAARPFDVVPEPLFKEPPLSFDAMSGDDVLVVGTFDTKGVELSYIRDKVASHGLRVRTVDLSTTQKPSSADVPPHMVAAYHPGGASAVFTGDRGKSVRAMAEAFENWIRRQRGLGGIISAGGSGGTALVTPAMRQLPVGIPKVMISTVASGEVGQYVGPTDIMMMYSVTDVQGLNKISRRVLANGANAISGMVMDAKKHPEAKLSKNDKPGLGLTMFGVTTQAIQQLTAELEDHFECMVFHATGTGGRSMEKLVDSGMLEAAIDLTTTEICDMMMGGFFAATEDRFDAFIRTRVPYVGSVGALDMVNFGARNTVPERYRDRKFVEHNPQITLMRTTAAENARMGEWIADKLNQMTGPVRFLIPEGGVSALDAPGQPFHDPEANRALFDALTSRFRETAQRRLIRTPYHINEPAFTQAVIAALEEIYPIARSKRNAAY
ncbi:Tm-1-like ATP-binding domain-containing protein [Sneathiella sp. CAU 1612]|uniref:Tm-1-like ATP-binding domain-containing protein n=1 Tax=Sneathiella sedimenti TaxID=2816034 RepID=A0ABS3F435_9PROT|nr:Tm-1-like ATP-binding domain-containing protein [Sneathiella sedimenti]MBO0333256.1 Tm-1-like ATP-binding domain-containing protein [Sneathiella sedimenti]